MRELINKSKEDLGERYDLIIYSAIVGMLNLFTTIPFYLRYRFGGFLGGLIYRLDKRHRGFANRNLQLAFPEWDEAKQRQVAYESFVNFGRLLMEFMQFPRFSKEDVSEMVTLEGIEHIENARKRGNGAIFLNAHYGNWELSAYAFSLLVEPAGVVVRPLDSKVADKLVSHYRTLGGNYIINRRRAAVAILRAFKRQQPIGILMDQNQLRSQGIFADFFGIPASTTPGIALIARKTGCSVVPAFLIRDGYKKYRLIFWKEIEIEVTDDKEKDLVENTTRFNQVVEKMIRMDPSQYFWLHRRWKTRPEGEQGFY